MTIRRTSHAVYNTRYHLIWAPKYRKWILRGDLREFVEIVFKEIALANEFEIEAMEIAEDHVHIFLGFPPRYSISQVVQRFKGRSVRKIFQVFPDVKKELWGGEFWEDGNFARTLGDKATKDLIKNYIKYHKHKEKTPQQLDLF
jgi:REP-associated tyrosine transposase